MLTEGSLAYRVILYVIFGLTAAVLFAIVTVGALAGDDTCRLIVLTVVGPVVMGIALGVIQILNDVIEVWRARPTRR